MALFFSQAVFVPSYCWRCPEPPCVIIPKESQAKAKFFKKEEKA